MAIVIIKLKVMPASPEVNLNFLNKVIEEKIVAFSGKIKEITIEPVAFGLKASIISFSLDESKGSTDMLEEEISMIPDVESVNIIGVSRALG